MDPLARSLDFANHHANSTPSDIKKLCEQVVQYGFHAAFVNPTYVTLAKEILGNKAPVGTVVSFPLGQDTLATKVAAVNEAVTLGADELDIVPNIGNFSLQELKDIVDAGRMVGKSVIIKFILEPGYLTEEQLAHNAMLIKQSGADYVKIGSGMGPRNPTLEDLRVVKEAIGDSIKIKVAGGIETRAQAEAFLAAGAYHLGTSHAIDIVTTAPPKKSSKAKRSQE